jgi:hypothetical protein
MYMPTQVATYEIGSQTYFVFANSGTHRAYEAFDDRIMVKEIKLDEQRFPDAEFLQKPENLGNLRVSNVDGDHDRDGDFDAIFAFGGRSFSILSANGLRYVSDSGNDFEQITALAIPNYFNTADHKNKFESESDAKGPKPLSVTTGKIGEKTYAFIGLERIGGVMVYDVSDPQSPQFQQYINNRNFAIDPEAPQDPGDPNSPPICVSGEAESERCAAVGDLSAEDLVFIASDQSPVATPLLVVGNQTSGSATIFRISSVEDTASLDQ